MSDTVRRIGVIGVGRMGLPMCARLVDCGFAVLATDIRSESRGHVVAARARWAESLQEVAAESDVVISVLPGPGEVSAVVEPVLQALPRGGTWIEMSTASPAIAAQIMRRARGRGIRTFEAPVGGNPTTAREGQLVAFVGAAEEDLNASRDVLDSLAERVVHLGPPGSGYVAKLLINFLWFGQALAAAEALTIAERTGLDPETFRSAVQESAAAGRFMDQGARALLTGDDMTSFPLARCLEELQSVLRLGRDVDVPLALGERISEIYGQTLEHYGDVDGELLGARLVAERAGVTFHRPR